MEEESQSDPAVAESSEVLNIHIHRPSCPSILEIGLLAFVSTPLIAFSVAWFHPRFDAADALGVIVGFEITIVIIFGAVAVVAVIGDAISGRHSRRQKEILTALGRRTAKEEFELRVNLLAKKRNTKIHLGALELTLNPRPSAVFLSAREQRDWPMPRPCNIPFEPVPLGRDPFRTALLLSEFVELPGGGAAVPHGPLKRIRSWLGIATDKPREASSALAWPFGGPRELEYAATKE